MVEAIEKEKTDSKKRMKTMETGIEEEMKKDKKELIGKIETVEADLKKKVEMEANTTRLVQGWQNERISSQTLLLYGF